MLKPGDIAPQGFGAFSIFAVLAALTLLMSANYVSPGCTGPEVKRCDYIATLRQCVSTKRAVAHVKSDIPNANPCSPTMPGEVL